MSMSDVQISNNRNKWNKRIFNIIKLIVTGSLLYYIFYRYININDLLTAFSNIRPELFFVLLILLFANRVLLAYQTSYYFKKIFDIDLGINFVFKVQMISSFFAFVLPGELAGGLISWYMVSEKSGKKVDSAVVIIFLRLLSIITMISFTAIGFVFEEKVESLGLQSYIFLIAVLSLLMFVPFVSSKAATAIKQFSLSIVQVTLLKKWRNNLVKLNNKLWDSVISCTNADQGSVLYTLSMTVMWYLLVILFFYLLMIMVGINLPFQVSVWLIGVITIVQYLPVSFAGLGVRDISIIYLLNEFYQVRPESSMILSTFFLAFSLIFVIMGGMATWLKLFGHHEKEHGWQINKF
jgi:hypothetical protein